MSALLCNMSNALKKFNAYYVVRMRTAIYPNVYRNLMLEKPDLT